MSRHSLESASIVCPSRGGGPQMQPARAALPQMPRPPRLETPTGAHRPCPRWPYDAARNGCLSPVSESAENIRKALLNADPVEVTEDISSGVFGKNTETLGIIMCLVRERVIPGHVIRALCMAISADKHRDNARRDSHCQATNRIVEQIMPPHGARAPTTCDACLQPTTAPLRCRADARCAYVLCAACTASVELSGGACPNCRQPRMGRQSPLCDGERPAAGYSME